MSCNSQNFCKSLFFKPLNFAKNCEWQVIYIGEIANNKKDFCSEIESILPGKYKTLPKKWWGKCFSGLANKLFTVTCQYFKDSICLKTQQAINVVSWWACRESSYQSSPNSREQMIGSQELWL